MTFNTATSAGNTGYPSDSNGLANTTAGTITINPPTLQGRSIAETTVVTLETTVMVPSFGYDERGNITGYQEVTGFDTYTDTATYVTAGVGFYSSAAQSYTTRDGDGPPYTLTSTLYTINNYTYAGTTNVSCVMFQQIYGNASVMEATLSSAYRFGTNGQYDVLQGPQESCYYPFFSQVWQGLWMPMTYTDEQTDILVTTFTIAGDNDQTYTLETTTTETSYTYSWDNTHTNTLAVPGRVWVTTASKTPITVEGGDPSDPYTYTTEAGASDNVASASGTFSFIISAEAAESYSFFTTSFYPGGNQGYNSPDTYYGDFVIGGKQWASNQEIAILFRGSWGATSVYADGQTNSETFTVEDYTTTTAGNDVAVWYRALPCWESFATSFGASTGNLTILNGPFYDLIHTGF